MKKHKYVALALLLALAVSTPVNADSAEYGPRVGYLSWPQGKEHSTFEFILQDGSWSEVRRGPSQSRAEYVRIEADQIGSDRLGAYVTIIFLIARNEDDGTPFVVVPGFKTGESHLNEYGVPTMRVVRPHYTKDDSVLRFYAVGRSHQRTDLARGVSADPVTERDRVAAIVARTLASRDLGNAPILIW